MRGGTIAPPKNNNNQISRHTNQNESRNGIGMAERQARTELKRQNLREKFDS